MQDKEEGESRQSSLHGHISWVTLAWKIAADLAVWLILQWSHHDHAVREQIPSTQAREEMWDV